jgi:hypothetical protein
MSNVNNSKIGMKEQMQDLIERNIETNPDAIRLIMHLTDGLEFDLLYTHYEAFFSKLSGEYENFWTDIPASEEVIAARGKQQYSKIACIKWYRNKTGRGLKESKERIEEYINSGGITGILKCEMDSTLVPQGCRYEVEKLPKLFSEFKE